MTADECRNANEAAIWAAARDLSVSDERFLQELRRRTERRDLEELPALDQPRTFLTSERTQR